MTDDTTTTDETTGRTDTQRTTTSAGGTLAALLLGGLLGASATGTASADPQGQVGTSSDPLTALYTEELNGGVTGDTSLTSLTGDGLTIDANALSAAPARPDVEDGTTSVTDASELTFGDGLQVLDDGDGTVTVDVDLDYTYRRGDTLSASSNSSKRFGYSVALTPDASLAVVGDWNAGSDNKGRVFVFDRTGPTKQVTALSESINELGFEIKDLGYSVAVSDDERWVFTGSPTSDVGDAGVGVLYSYDLTSADIGSSSDRITIDGSDFLGADVALNDDGTTAIAGDPKRTVDGTNGVGSAFVLDVTASDPATTKQQVTASDGASEDHFGSAVAVTPDGTTAVVGAPGHEGRGGGEKAYVYDLSGSTPTETEKLTASDSAGSEDRFGSAVAISDDGETVVVSAPQAPNDGSSGPGKVYVYDLSESPPTETILTATDGQDGDEFGQGVALVNDTVTVTAPSASTTTTLAESSTAVSGLSATGTDTLTVPIAQSIDPIVEVAVTDDDGTTDTRSVTLADTVRTTDASLDVDSLAAEEVNESSSDAEFDVSWAVSDTDGSLSSVDLTLYEQNLGGSDTQQDSVSVSVSGSSASGTDTLSHAGAEGSGLDYRIEVTVSDGTTTAVASGVVTEIESIDSPRVTNLFVWESASGPDQRSFTLDWGVADDSGTLSTVDATLRGPADQLYAYDLTASDPTAADAETQALVAVTDDAGTKRRNRAVTTDRTGDVALVGRPSSDPAISGRGIVFTRTS